jgi:signal transduction histidine kinase
MIERIVREARQISSALDDIVWSINPSNDGFGNLVARINRHAAELFEAAEIQYEITIPEGVDRINLSMEKRQDLYLIAKEAVNNLVKHAQATQAQVTIVLLNTQLQLTVWDNGRGFDVQARTERNGLRNMQARARQLGGTLRVDSGLGQGTTLQLTFPVST